MKSTLATVVLLTCTLAVVHGLPVGCGVSKGCFESPKNCSGSNCEYLVTWKNNGDKVDFTIEGNTPGWMAIGFSKDQAMGDDSVAECLWDSANSKMLVRNSWNSGKGNIAEQDPTGGLTNMQGSYVNGRLSCSFTRAKVLPLPLKATFSDLKFSYYLLVARGYC